MSIRARLTTGIVVLLLVVFSLLGAAIVATTRATLVQQVDARVLAATVRLDPAPAPDRGRGRDGSERGHGSDDGDGHDGRGGDDGPAVPPPVTPAPTTAPDGSADSLTYERPVARIAIGPDGRLLAASPSGYPDDPDPLPMLPVSSVARLADLTGRIVTLPTADGSLEYRALVQGSPDRGFVVTAAPLSSVDDAIGRIVRTVALAAVAALALAALGSWWLIRHGLQPVDRMIETAAAIGEGDLTRRVPDADPRTELGRLGGALNRMLAQIEQAAAARAASEERLRRFVADAAHELRTPLTSLRGYAELYRQGALPDPPAVDRAMGRIESEATRMARLVDDLLLLARLDQQRALEHDPVDLADLAREAAADFAAADPERPLDLQLARETVVLGDRARLRQVLDNLLANARTHTPSGTPVHLSVDRDGRDAVLTVSDEGPGIPPEDRERVFERFWRSDPGRARSRGGSGLGLAIVASLVAAHGGSVAVGGEPGRGAVFTVRLPLAGS